MLTDCGRLDVIYMMGDFIFAIFVTLVIPVINYSNSIDKTFFGCLFKVKLWYFIIISAG